MESKKKAVFAVYFNPESNMVAATTRPEDNEVSFGLPGGKVDPGESELAALFREAEEEGWDITGSHPEFFHTEDIEGFEVIWYRVQKAVPLQEYKEKYRGIEPVMINVESFFDDNKYGNACLKKLF